jgi:hypothetical protein
VRCGVDKVRCSVRKVWCGVAKVRCGIPKVECDDVTYSQLDCGEASQGVVLINCSLVFKEILSKRLRFTRGRAEVLYLAP